MTVDAARAGVRYTTRFIGQDGAVLAEASGLSPHYRFRGTKTYVRASIVDSNGHRAWTQPVFRDGRPALRQAPRVAGMRAPAP